MLTAKSHSHGNFSYFLHEPLTTIRKSIAKTANRIDHVTLTTQFGSDTAQKRRFDGDVVNDVWFDLGVQAGQCKDTAQVLKGVRASWIQRNGHKMNAQLFQLLALSRIDRQQIHFIPPLQCMHRQG